VLVALGPHDLERHHGKAAADSEQPARQPPEAADRDIYAAIRGFARGDHQQVDQRADMSNPAILQQWLTGTLT
jgi:hypothetical protein